MKYVYLRQNIWEKSCEREKDFMCRLSRVNMQMYTENKREADLEGAPTNNRHPLALVAEVQNGQQLVDSGFPHLHHCDCLRCAGAEHKAKVPSSSDQGTFIWWLSLVHQLTWWEKKATEPTEMSNLSPPRSDAIFQKAHIGEPRRGYISSKLPYIPSPKRLRTLAAHWEDQGSVPSTHTLAYNHL